jgi:predicted dehydrogenase/nucleoside phosphorylase
MPVSAGNVFAAIAADRVKHNIKPDVIMFVGCAGGIPSKVEMFDIVVADKIYHYEPGKVDVELLPRPDSVRPTRQLLERAKAEQYLDRWRDVLYPQTPNESVAVRIEPIAAGELLVRNSRSEHLTHIEAVAPRSIAVEQEGYGVLLAAHQNNIHAIVIRGISDVIDNKASAPIEGRLPALNQQQVKATKYAAAFALTMLEYLDVRWLRDVDYVGRSTRAGQLRTTIQIVLDGDVNDFERVSDAVHDWFKEGTIRNFKIHRGSVNVQFDVEAGHAVLFRVAWQAGLMTELAGGTIKTVDPTEGTASDTVVELCELIHNVKLGTAGWGERLRVFERAGNRHSEYRYAIGKIVEAAEEQVRIANLGGATEGPRTAVIGCGAWGKSIVRTLAQLGVLHSVCDINTRVAEDLGAKFSAPARKFAEILEDVAVEAIAIATPSTLHADHVGRALRAGKHVFVEKPLGKSVSEGRVLAKLASERKRVLMVGHVLRYHPVVRKLLEVVQSGRLGTVRHVYSRRLGLGKIRTEEDVLWSFAPHDISIILAIFGQMPKIVSAHGRAILNSDIADIARVHLDFAKGVTADIAVSWLNPVKEHKLVLIGSRAQAVFDDTARWHEKLQIFDHGVDVMSGTVSVVKAEPILVHTDEREPLKEELSHFLDAVRNGQEPDTDAEEGLRVLRVLEACAKSLATGTPIALENDQGEMPAAQLPERS